MDQNTHLGSLLVPATFLGLVGPSPVIRVCERGAFDLVIFLTKSKAPRLHTKRHRASAVARVMWVFIG